MPIFGSFTGARMFGKGGGGGQMQLFPAVIIKHLQMV